MNDATSWADVYTVTKETPGSPGSSYIKLASMTVGNKVVNGVAVSGKLDTATLEPVSGFAFNGQPKSLTGKYKHMIFGGSQGCICVMLTKWDNSTQKRKIVAQVNDTLVDMDMSWTPFSTDLIYQSMDIPDSCIIVLKSSGADPTEFDYLCVDNLAFEGTVSGIQGFENDPSTFLAYPNPATNFIVVEFISQKQIPSTIQMVDVLGRMVREVDHKMNNSNQILINTEALAKGTYFLKVMRTNSFEIKKIIIQ
jgi:hypothetical protein